jgi:hypothetical protein
MCYTEVRRFAEEAAMRSLSWDITPEIEEILIDRLRQMPAHQKLAQVSRMTRTVRDLAIAGLRQRHPDDTPLQRQRRLASLLLGDVLAERVYGPLLDDV